ncbi:hypothetical protein ACIGO6_36800, partial [Streptomyces sp. NPDC053750]|uniref:hypothetical protein n=1 Tax=Streptomyces sp. NPDC053750 TaxID=3365714 RepID=UPI0037D581A2
LGGLELPRGDLRHDVAVTEAVPDVVVPADLRLSWTSAVVFTPSVSTPIASFVLASPSGLRSILESNGGSQSNCVERNVD